MRLSACVKLPDNSSGEQAVTLERNSAVSTGCAIVMSVYAAAGKRMWSPCELSSRYECETNKQKSWFTWLEATWQDWFNSVLQLNKVVRKLARRVWLHRLNSQAFPGSVCLVRARLCACSTCMLSHYWYVVCRVWKNTPRAQPVAPLQQKTTYLSPLAAWYPHPSTSYENTYESHALVPLWPGLWVVSMSCYH